MVRSDCNRSDFNGWCYDHETMDCDRKALEELRKVVDEQRSRLTALLGKHPVPKPTPLVHYANAAATGPLCTAPHLSHITLSSSEVTCPDCRNHENFIAPQTAPQHEYAKHKMLFAHQDGTVRTACGATVMPALIVHQLEEVTCVPCLPLQGAVPTAPRRNGKFQGQRASRVVIDELGDYEKRVESGEFRLTEERLDIEKLPDHLHW